MINVNKITSTLAKLPDQQLQQYAQMHKSDPYIMALAMSESNRRKEMRAAGQGGQGMQEQPKVVDSEIAQMAPQQMPEDMGIGQLPAGEMNFAGGGIIAFADGGDVERYQSGGSIAAKYQQESQEMGMGMRRQYSPDVQAYAQMQAQPSAEEQQMFKAEQQRMLAGGRFNAFPVLPTVDGQAPAAAAAAPTTLSGKPAAPTAPAPSPRDDSFRRQTDPRMLGVSATPPVNTAPAADTTRRPTPGAGLGAAAPAAAGPRAATETGPSGIDALQQKYFGQIDQEVGGLKNARAGLVAGITELAAQNLAATKADIEKRGDVYKGREERLAKQEKGLEGMSDKNMGLALLQAGAAMMSTPGGLGVALGKGVQVGSERYAAGLDKIEAAKSKFAEARDRLDDLRINRDDMNAKDIRAAEKEARESALKGKELLYNGLVSDLGIKQKNVTAIFGAAADDLKTTRQIAAERENTLIRERGATARNQATTNAAMQSPERLAFLSALEKTKTKENPQGDPAAAYQSIIAMKREPVSIENLRKDWLDTAKKMEIQSSYPNIKTFEDYVAVFGGGVGGAGGSGGDGFKVVGVR